jgi:hypothetical protein
MSWSESFNTAGAWRQSAPGWVLSIVKGALKAGTIAIGVGDFIAVCRVLVVQK